MSARLVPLRAFAPSTAGAVIAGALKQHAEPASWTAAWEGKTPFYSCAFANANTPRHQVYGRCGWIHGNGFERSTYVRLGNQINTRFENNALCAMSGNNWGSESTLRLEHALQDASVCANRIDGGAGRFYLPVHGQAEPPRLGIQIATPTLRHPAALPVPERHSIRVVGNAVGGVTRAAMVAFSDAGGPDLVPPWIQTVYGGNYFMNLGLTDAYKKLAKYPANVTAQTSSSDGVRPIVWAWNAVRLRPPFDTETAIANDKYVDSTMWHLNLSSVFETENTRTLGNRYGIAVPASSPASTDNGMCRAEIVDTPLGPETKSRRVWPFRLPMHKDGASSRCLYGHVEGMEKLGEVYGGDLKQVRCMTPERGSEMWSWQAAEGQSPGVAVCESASLQGTSSDFGDEACSRARTPDGYQADLMRGRLLNGGAGPNWTPSLAACAYTGCTNGDVPGTMCVAPKSSAAAGLCNIPTAGPGDKFKFKCR